MKKSILVIAACTFITGAFLTSCSSTPAEKVENAENKVIVANKDLDDANKAYLADVENYRLETAKTIAENEKSAADFKARVAKDKKAVRDDYYKKIAKLEQKNTDMKKSLDDYKAESKEKWETFKAEFSNEMRDLSKSFKDLTVKSEK